MIESINQLWGVKLNVAPSETGEIICSLPDTSDGKRVSQNYRRYVAGESIECDAKANSGYEFSSWSGDYDINSCSNHIDSLDLIKYGEVNANFVVPSQINIPSEFPGFFVPSIIKYLNCRRQRGYRESVKSTYKRLHENKSTDIKSLEDIRMKVRRIHEEGKINESHLEILNKTILEYEERLKRS